MTRWMTVARRLGCAAVIKLHNIVCDYYVIANVHYIEWYGKGCDIHKWNDVSLYSFNGFDDVLTTSYSNRTFSDTLMK